MRAMIILRFPGQRTYSPERQVLPLSVGVPAFADVRYPTVTAEAFSESHTDTQVEFRKVLLPQAAMVQALAEWERPCDLAGRGVEGADEHAGGRWHADLDGRARESV